MRVLVTGATGFVGRHLCPTLVERGYDVTAAVRRDGDAIPAEGVRQVVVGDLGPDTNWHAALDGVDAVIHMAARTHVIRETAADPEAEYHRINVGASQALVESARKVGVRRFIYLSSVKVNGEKTTGEPFKPDDPPAPEDAYGRTKREAEEICRRQFAGTATELTIIRPPLVYGPGVKGNFLTLMRAADKGVPLPVSMIRNRRALIYVGNLVDVLVRALSAPVANETFLVSDGEDVSTPELMRGIATALGRAGRLFPVPVWMLRLGGVLTGRRAVIDRVAGSLQIDSSKARSILDWAPPFTMKQGLELTASWYKSQGPR